MEATPFIIFLFPYAKHAAPSTEFNLPNERELTPFAVLDIFCPAKFNALDMPFPTDVYDPIEPVSPLSNTVPFSTRSAKSLHFTFLFK